MKFNPQIHHRKSIRLRGYDYSKSGHYFITICCHDRQHLFGEIFKGEMLLNTAGIFTESCWLSIPDHFPNVVLHSHVVMPNHIHGVIEIIDRKHNVNGDTVGAEDFLPLQLQTQKHEFQKMIPRSIASIVKGFKIGVTKWFRSIGYQDQVWQRNYHERIIRDEIGYQNVSTYVINNPLNWKQDEFNS